MPQLWYHVSRTDPNFVAAPVAARPATSTKRCSFPTVRAGKEDAGGVPQPQQPSTSLPKRLLSPPPRQLRDAVPSSAPRIQWNPGQQRPAGSPQPPDSSNNTNTPATPGDPQQQATAKPAPADQQQQEKQQQQQQQQQQGPQVPSPPTDRPADPPVPAASSRTPGVPVPAQAAPSPPLPQPQPYLQQQPQAYSRMEQQQQTQRRQAEEVPQVRQHQQEAQQEEARATTTAGHRRQQKKGQRPPVPSPDRSGTPSATTTSSSGSSSGSGREEVISVAPQYRRPAPQPSFTPMHQVSKTTRVHALGGALAAESALSPHQLLLAWGPEAVNTAVKGCATARRKLKEAAAAGRTGTGPGGSNRRRTAAQRAMPAGAGGGAGAAGGVQEWDLVVQPTLRGHGVGTAALAFDVLRIPWDSGAASTWQPGKEASDAGVVFRRIATTSNEHMWARSLAVNMPNRHQTVLTVCGAQAVLTAVLAVALARDLLRRSTGFDLVILPQWGYSKAHRREVGLQLVVMCCTDEFPPQLVTGGVQVRD